MLQDCLLQGQKACVHFRFQRHPEFLRTGWRILFRNERTRGMGEIKRLVTADDKCPAPVELTIQPSSIDR